MTHLWDSCKRGPAGQYGARSFCGLRRAADAVTLARCADGSPLCPECQAEQERRLREHARRPEAPQRRLR